MKENMSFDMAIIKVGDVLISKPGNYHYIVDKIDVNEIHLSWLERKDEPITYYSYRRVRKLDGIAKYYDVIPSEQVDWSKYKQS